MRRKPITNRNRKLARCGEPRTKLTNRRNGYIRGSHTPTAEGSIAGIVLLGGREPSRAAALRSDRNQRQHGGTLPQIGRLRQWGTDEGIELCGACNPLISLAGWRITPPPRGSAAALARPGTRPPQGIGQLDGTCGGGIMSTPPSLSPGNIWALGLVAAWLGTARA